MITRIGNYCQVRMCVHIVLDHVTKIDRHLTRTDKVSQTVIWRNLPRIKTHFIDLSRVVLLNVAQNLDIFVGNELKCTKAVKFSITHQHI